jgi:hypothetical protein
MCASRFNSATTRRAIASIRRLCCLGLGGQIAVPALLGELRGSEVMRYRESTTKVDKRSFEKHDFYNLVMGRLVSMMRYSLR